MVHLLQFIQKSTSLNLNSPVIQLFVNYLKRFQTDSNVKNTSKNAFLPSKNAEKHAFLHYFSSKSLKNCPFQRKTGSKIIKKSRKICFFAPLMVQSNWAKAENFHWSMKIKQQLPPSIPHYLPLHEYPLGLKAAGFWF